MPSFIGTLQPPRAPPRANGMPRGLARRSRPYRRLERRLAIIRGERVPGHPPAVEILTGSGAPPRDRTTRSRLSELADLCALFGQPDMGGQARPCLGHVCPSGDTGADPPRLIPS